MLAIAWFERDWEILSEAFGAGGFLASVIALLVYIGFLASISRLLGRVDPDNRRMQQGQVWLNLLPIFNLLWLVVAVERVGESIRNEYISRGRHHRRESYGKSSGLAWLILSGASVLFASAESPCALLLLPFAFIYWIVYWSILMGYSRKLRQGDPSYYVPVDEGW